MEEANPRSHMIPSKSISVLEILQIIVLASVIMYFGKTLLIPLSFALLMSFLLYPACSWMESKGINKGVAILVSILVLTIMVGSILYLFFAQIVKFSNEWHTIKEKLLATQTQLSTFIAENFGVSSESQLTYLNKAIDDSSSQIVPLLQNTFYSISESLFYLIMILIFTALILFHRKMLSKAIYHIFPYKQRNTIHEILLETIQSYYKFFKGMLIVYLMVGTLNSIGLAIIGVPHPILFGFTASILTFIPYVGILIASLLPIAISWIEFNSIWYPIGVVIVFTIVQLLEAYIIFPMAVGGRLKINTFVIILTIVAGGILWGAVGMILFIPFISIVKLIADRSEKLKTLSILLGDGNDESIKKN